MSSHLMLDWESSGYFIPEPDAALAQEPESGRWLQWWRVLHEAKAGKFESIPSLIDLYPRGPATLQFNCSRLIGDAGRPQCFERWMAEFHDPDHPLFRHPLFRLHVCSALTAWGSLSAVPFLVDAYVELEGFQDAEVLPLFLSSLLEQEWGDIAEGPQGDMDGYRAKVLQYHEKLKRQLGTDNTIVLWGEVFSVSRLAKLILERQSNAYFHIGTRLELRRKFEAATGIDCRAFFKDRKYQPLAAATIVERFLESPTVKRYEEGARYFFGHLIPE